MIGRILATRMYRSGNLISATLMYLKWTDSFIEMIRTRAAPGWVGSRICPGDGWPRPGLTPVDGNARGEVVRLPGPGSLTSPGALARECQWRSVSALSATFGAGCSVEVEAASSADSAAI